MKWVNPSVAWMYETAMPGLLARSFGRLSYKSDERSRQSPEHAAVRQRLVDGLRDGGLRLGTAIGMDDDQARAMVAEPSAGPQPGSRPEPGRVSTTSAGRAPARR